MNFVQLVKLNLKNPQPVADKPFTLEAEVDDLPKETLKAQIYEESSGFPSTCFNGKIKKSK